LKDIIWAIQRNDQCDGSTWGQDGEEEKTV